MSEINSIANGTFTIGQTSATNFVAGPGIKIDEPSAGTVRIGNDETVLFQSTGFEATTCDLSEPPKNFESIKFWLSDDTPEGRSMGVAEFYSKYITAAGSTVKCAYTIPWNTSGFRCISVSANSANNYTHWVTNGYQWWGNGGGLIQEGYMRILKVVGLNRISGNA